jgi:hypothetical protein
VRYWNTKRQGFSPECEGFSLNSAYGFPNRGFSAGFCAKGHLFSRVRLKQSSQMRLRRDKARRCKHKGIDTSMEIEILYLLSKINIPSTI